MRLVLLATATMPACRQAASIAPVRATQVCTSFAPMSSVIRRTFPFSALIVSTAVCSWVAPPG